MHRVLFKIGSVTLYSYGLMLILAFFVGAWFARRRAPKYGIDPEKIWDVAFWMLMAGVLGARVLFILQDLPYFLQNRDQLFSLRFEGLTSYGGVLGGFIAVLIWCRVVKVPVVKLLDVLGPAFLVGHAIGRVGCLLNGCCYGGQCDLPWGIHVLSQDGKTFLPGLYNPAQIYDSLMNLVALAIVLYVERFKPKTGRIAALVIFLHASCRFIYEFWRAGTTSELYGKLPLTEAQLAAGVLMVVGAALWFWFGSRKAADSR